MRHEPDACGFFGVDVATGDHDLERPRRADRTWEEVAHPQLGGREAVLYPGRAEVRQVRGDADVGGEAEAEAAADGRAVDGADHRLRHPPQGEHDVVEDPHGPSRDTRSREAVDVGDRSRVLEVGARAEAASRPREDHDSDVVVLAHLLQRLAQGDHHVEGHGVHALGPVQRHERDVGSGLLDQYE